MAMGGRAADRLVLGQPYAGAESDLKQATKIARYMVTHWGMSDRLGPISLRIGEEHVFLGKETYFVGADHNLMPTKKDQPPPDLKYFNQPRK